MKTLKTLTLAFLLPVLLTVNAQENRKITVFTIGDSTMANKDTTDQNPERGWAMAFQALFNADFVTVDNHAVNGRSSKSFFDEGRWQKVLDLLREGDYVFIQFGHNDEKTQDAKRYTDPATTFREFLTKYVTETRSKGATPVLLTPIARRKFSDENGFPLDTHGDYPAAMREVSKSLDVPLIDMTELTGRMLLVMGKEDSKRLFMHLQPGQVKKYPNGLQDDTHLNEYGAAYIARMVAGAIRNQQLPLAKYLTRDISSMNWGAVAGSMPEEWYGSAEAETVAENVLLYQRNTGGWQKNTPFHQKLS
ncbi:MAG: rhamnogalacturonan acetylesterase [Paludibacter sp.]|jgi:lysophospholipase L1-like esterase|nr:rhamnogalacturonan acetylesterase [Paludibacter sp.]